MTKHSKRIWKLICYVGPKGFFKPCVNEGYVADYVIWAEAPPEARFAIGRVSQMNPDISVWDLDKTVLSTSHADAINPCWRKFLDLDTAIAAAHLKADDYNDKQLTRLTTEFHSHARNLKLLIRHKLDQQEDYRYYEDLRKGVEGNE